MNKYKITPVFCLKPINCRLFLFFLFFSVQFTSAQIALRGTATTATNAANTVTINKPTGVVAGDIMIANVAGYLNGATTATTATGWTAIGATAIERATATLLYRIADASDASVTSYTFTTTASSNPSTGAIIAFSGVDTVTPFDGTQPSAWTTATATSISNLPSITTVNPGAALVQFGCASRITSTSNANFASWSLSSTELYDFGSNNVTNTVAVGAAWATRPTAGLTGAGGFTCTPNTSPRLMGGIMITLSPALQFRSVTSGNWSATSTWQQSVDGITWINAVSVPTEGDLSVTVRNGHTVTLSAAASSPNLTIDAGGTLTPGANLLNLFGDFVNNGTLTSGSGGITIAGNDSAQSIAGFTTTGTVSMTKTAGTATFTGNVNGAGLTMNGNGGTLNLGTGLTHTLTGAWTRTNGTLEGGSSLLRIAGSVSGTAGTFTAGTGTVEYNGAAQTAAVVTYNNLTLSGSAAKTFATTPTVNGILSLEGTATVTVTTGVVTYGPGATLQYNNRGTYTGTAEECTLSATTNLVILGTSTITLPGNQNLNSVTVNSGSTLTLGALVLTINGGLTNSGTINATTGGLNQVAASTADFTNTGSVVFTGAGQVAFARNFSNSGTFTLAGSSVTLLGTNTQSIAGFTTTGDVSMTKTGGTATFTSNVNGAGLTINGNGGTLNLGTGLTHTFTGAWTRTNGTLNGGSSILRIAGSVSGTGGTFTAGTGTVEYNGAAQTAAVVTYNNLTLSGSAAKTFATTPTVNGILSLEGTATVTVTTGVVTYGSGATLQYNNRGTYTGTAEECTLSATTNLVILGTSTITLPGNQNLNSLTVNSGSTLTLGALVLTINGGLTNSGTINATTGGLNQVAASTGDFTNTGSVVFTGAGQVAFARNFSNSGTFTLAGSSVTLLGANTQSIAGFTTTGTVSMTKTAGTATFTGTVNGAGLTMNGLGGTLNLGTGLTHTFTGAWTRTNGTLEGGSSLLRIAGSVSGATGTFTAGTGTVEYNGAAQTAAFLTYNNLVLSGSGSKNIGVSAVNGNLTMSGDNTTSFGNTISLVISGNLTVGAGNTFSANGDLTVTGNASISGTVSSSGFSAKSIGGNFIINSGGTWTELSGPTYTFSGNFTNDGTFNAGTSTATFSGTTQSIGGASTTTFNNLTLATSASTKTFGRVINVTGALVINTGVQANLGTFVHSAGSLTLGGSAQGTASSYGGTGSRAANINGTFFAASTGVVNVGTCAAASITSTTVASPVCTSGASVTLANTTASNLPAGSYVVYYTLSGVNTGSFTANMTIGTPGTGTFTTGTLSNTGSTTITINDLRNGCVSNITSGNTASFTVNPNLAASVSIAASPSTTICSGTNVTFTATPTNGGTPSYQWKLNGNNVGTNGTTYSNSALANGDAVSVVMTSTATCATGSPATSNTLTMTVNSGSTSAVLSGTTTICSGAANLQVAVTGGVSPYTVVYSNGTSNTTVNNYTSGSNISVSPTGTTTYSLVSVTSAQGCAGAGNTGSATVTVGNCPTWNGSAWVNGTPTSTSILYFEGNYTVPGNLTAFSIVVNSGTVTLPSGVNATLAGPITVNGGSFVVENNANLIQMSSASNSGNIIVKRNTAALMRQDYVMWSSPLVGQQLQAFSPQTLSTRFYTYDSSTNLYTVVSSPSTTNFAVGTGYLIRMPNNHPTTPTIWSGTFTGVPTNGTVTLGSLTGNKYYAVGNPYPSTINADSFIIANSLTEALYFWRKTNAAQTSAYATYTLAGGTSNSGGDPLGLIPNGFIQVGQGFIAKTPASATSLTFTNSMRTANNSNQFFRMTDNRSRIWLNMTNSAGYFGQTMIAYMPTATLGFDPAIDGRYMNDFGTALTSLIGAEEYAIQGRPLPFETTDVVPLGFKSLEAGSFTITLNQVDGIFETQGITIYLRDNLSNTVHNLSLSPYTFATEVGTFNGRFELVYQEGSMGITPIQFNQSQVVVYKTQTNQLLVNSGTVTMSTIKIFDLQGRLLYEKKDVNATEAVCQIPGSAEVLMVQIWSTDGVLVTKKVLAPKSW